MADPFSGGTSIRYRPRALYRTPLDERDSDSTLKQLTGYGSSLLQTGLDILDKPGRAVRGALAGNFRELGNLIPFSDTLGITDAGDRTSGRDLTDAIGLTKRTSRGWGAWGAGLATEMLTDPLTYITGGAKNALTPAGRAASKAGALKGFSRADILKGFDALESSFWRGGGPGALEHAINQGQRVAPLAAERAAQAAGVKLVPGEALGGLVGVGLPWGAPKAILGTGKTALGIGSKLDLVGDKLKYGTAVGRWANALFDPNVREAVGGASQKAMARYGTPAIEAAQAEGRDTLYRVMSAVDDAIRSGVDEGEALRAARQNVEAVNYRGVGPDAQAAAGKIGGFAGAAERRQLDAAQKIGLPLGDLADDYAQYMPRQGVDLDAVSRSAAGKPGRVGLQPQVISRNNMPVATGANFHRDELWRNIPGGTEMVNDLVMEHAGNIASRPLADIAVDISAKLQREISPMGGLPPATVKVIDDKAKQLAARIAGLSPDYAKHQIGLYSPHIAADVARSAEQHARTMGTAEAVMGFVGDNARAAGSLPSDAVPVSKLLSDLGFVTRDGGGLAHSGGMVEAYKRLAKQGAGRVDPLLTGSIDDLRKAVDGFAVTRQHYDELMKSHGRWSTPEVLAGPAGLFGNLTRSFKNLAYPIWPASHVRNAFSAGLNNLMRGTSVADHAAQFALMRGTATAEQLRRVAPGLPAGLSDDAAREWVRREQFATGKVYNGHVGQSDLDDALAAKLQSQVPGRVTPAPFGTDRTGGGNFARDASALIGGGVRDQLFDVLRWLRNPRSAPSPLRMDGAWGSTSNFPLLEAGRRVGANVEDFFRGANWLGNRRAGATAAEAGAATRNLHFDYDQLTQFEKKVMRNLVPFYTFARKNSAAQAENLIRSPGSVVAQMRVMDSGRDKDGYTPGYLASGTAIPVGPERDGTRRFISSFGTPLEEALGRFQFKNGLPDWRGTAMQFASSLNPLVKAPLEQLFNTQFQSGRPLSSLRPSATASALGRLVGDDNPQVLAQILANTPATRFLSSIDKLIDDRKEPWAKALNLGTGVKVTDVDIEKARAIEAAQARNDILSRMPHVSSYTTFFPSKGEAENLTADEVQMLRMLATMQEQAKSRTSLAGQRIGVRMSP